MTDVFRLLTRSTTFSRNTQKPSPAVAAPPAAAASQPTLSKSQKKRKRKAASGASRDDAATGAPISVPKELDFFGMGPKKVAEVTEGPAKKRKRRHVDGSDDEEVSSDDGASSGSEDEGDANDEEEEETVVLPTPEEIKSTLRTNKLKFTLLAAPHPEPAPAPAEKKKKKSLKKQAVEEAPKKKSKKPELLIPPLTDFTQLRSAAHGYALSKRVYANILAQGYASPTEVQMGALPVLMKQDLFIDGVPEGAPVDLLTCAPTGSGKTLAYVVPLINRLLRSQKESGAKKGIKAVILAPTKELVGQIVNEVKKLVKGTGIKVSQFKKGHRPVSSADILPEDNKEPCIKSDIVVSTPLLLKHAIEAAGESAMTGIQGLILDEADVLLDKLFREQTMGIWEALRDRAQRSLRTSLWSATMPSATEELTTKTLLSTPANPPHVVRFVVGIKDTSLPTVKQTLTYTATERGKLLALRQLFTTSLRPPILIFMQSIPRAQALFNEIQYDLPTPGRIAVLHSELTDTTREETMTRFRLGEVWILITTDLLSRGMDFRGVRMVINYDIPTSVASYIHRVGRTGRAKTEGGEAMTYYTKEDIQYVKGIANVIAASTSKNGESTVQKWLLDSLPKTSKKDKKKLKLHGVEARQGKDAKHRISTKSGFQRQVEDRRRGAKEASKRRKNEADESGSEDGDDDGGVPVDEEEPFAGFD
ncbi:P-loop containing nucleoside triphosphate hydrolase protein [Sphaerosporella brunnea]|uniref:ATP-dependent RNA helicase ROK1 n=1 Tax=Sphaerosporella brunnea TaxID=1250544 RepID=A0A5J5ELH8_9PEZI|nr:P-loop containing nucleoside triphosphate hydrolase protein [Sphaerosporella brunnea]